MVKIFLSIVFVLITVCASAQKTTTEVNIDIMGRPAMGNPFSAHIKINGDKMKVSVSKMDSVRFTALRQNPIYLKLITSDKFSNININDSAGRKLIQDISEITETYTIYTTDSVNVSKKANKRYFLLLDSVLATPTDGLVKEIKNRVVLDGISFKIVVKVKGKVIKNLYVRNPEEKYHPLVCRIISESFAIYRDKHPGSFFNKKVTYSY